MIQKKSPDFNKILRSILLILGIVFMLLKISAKAGAEGMASDTIDFVEDLAVYMSDDLKSSMETVYSDCPFFFYAEKNGFKYFVFYSNDDIYIRYFINRGDSFYGQFDMLYYVSVNSNIQGIDLPLSSNVPNYIYTLFQYYNHPTDWTLTKVNINSSPSYTMGSFGHYAPASMSLVYRDPNAPTGGYFSGEGVSPSLFEKYGGRGLSYGVNSSNYALYDIDNTFVSNPVDSRFTAWTSLDQAGKKLLNISWDSQVYPNTGSFTYQSSTIALQVAVNGQSSTVLFSSTDYPELFISGNSSYIPYKFIQKLANIATVQETDTFYLEKITLTQQAYPSVAGSSASQTFSASTVYSLNLGADVVEIPAVPSVTPVPISDTNIVDTTFFNNVVGGSVSVSADYPVPSWANHVQVAVGENPSAPYDLYLSWAYLEEISTQILDMDFTFGSGSSLVGADAELVTEYFKNLDYGVLFQRFSQDYLLDYADIVTFDCYNLDSSNNAYIVKRIVIYTDSYFYKMQLKSLGNLQDMIEANTYYVKALYDYSYARFNGMAESLESLRISNNNFLSSINVNILNLQDLVSSGTDRIVNAISGISSGGGGMSVSDLSGALNTLFMPSFEWDEVNYQDYLDSMGVLALPFEFVFDTQSIIKNNYSASLVMPVNDLSVPLGKDFSNNDIEFTVFEDHEDFTFSPTSIFPAALWSVFQYLAAFALVIGEAWFTYVHIFRKEEKSGDF